jgi:hypothetical protein
MNSFIVETFNMKLLILIALLLDTANLELKLNIIVFATVSCRGAELKRT